VLRQIVRRSLIPLLLVAAVLVAICWWRYDTDRKGRRELAAVAAQLDASEPRWRWEEIEADQPALRDEENSAHLVAEFRRTVGMDRYFNVSVPYESNPKVDRINCLLSVTDYKIVDKELAQTELAWPAMERLAETPRGRCTLLPSNSWCERRPPHEELVDSILNYLEWEAERVARTDDTNRQQTIARACLNAARIEQMSPLTGSSTSQRLRLNRAAHHVERVLALGRLGTRLSSLQFEFANEAEVDLFRKAVHLERAEYDRLCQAIATGEPTKEASLAYQIHGGCAGEAGLRVQAKVWLYRPYFAADWAAALNCSTSALAVANLPDEDRSVALAAIPIPPNDDRHPFSRTCAGWISRELNGSLRTKAMLRCTAAALAVERHRLLTGDWPASLDAIPRAILPKVPSDPFTGKPLGYLRRPDGVTIFASGAKPIEFRLFDSFWRGIGEIEQGPEPRIVNDHNPKFREKPRAMLPASHY
jgi:hypothetical protein